MINKKHKKVIIAKKAPRETWSRKQKHIYVFGKLSVYLDKTNQ